MHENLIPTDLIQMFNVEFKKIDSNLFFDMIFSNCDNISLFEKIINSYEMAMLEVEPNAESLNANGVENSEMTKLYELEGQYMTLVSFILIKCLDKVLD